MCRKGGIGVHRGCLDPGADVDGDGAMAPAAPGHQAGSEIVLSGTGHRTKLSRSLVLHAERIHAGCDVVPATADRDCPGQGLRWERAMASSRGASRSSAM